MASFDKTRNTENGKIMIPMEVDGDSNEGDAHPKGQGFLDEYNSDNSDEDNGTFLLNPFSASKTNKTAASGFGMIFGKYHVLFGILAVAFVFSAIAFLGRLRTPVLRFRLDDYSSPYYSHSHISAAASDQTFKIMQITDIHLGEAEYTDWGPKQDEKTFRLLEKIFEYEPDCDLIVLGGDQLTANNCLGNCTHYYGILGKFMSGYGVPWATIMGNHDDMDFEVEDGTGATMAHSYTRRDLLRVDQRFALSLSQSSTPGEVTGVTNYVLDVLDPITEKPALQIFFLDSGGGSLLEAINDDQIRWFREKAGISVDETTTTTKLPAVAFQHIPTWQHEYVDGTCLGYRGDGVAELEYDGGIVDAMIESGRFHFLAVGHNHGNDYCCPYGYGNNDNQDNNNLYFCFGRHSGYGGYGKWDRGVRIYELLMTADDEGDDNFYNEGSETTKAFKWRTWVSDNGREETVVLVHAATYTFYDARNWAIG
jgi:predicted MPP superfamily phosphohydrolase